MFLIGQLGARASNQKHALPANYLITRTQFCVAWLRFKTNKARVVKNEDPYLSKFVDDRNRLEAMYLPIFFQFLIDER